MNFKQIFESKDWNLVLNKLKAPLGSQTINAKKNIQALSSKMNWNFVSSLDVKKKIGIGVGTTAILVLGVILAFQGGTDVYQVKIAGQQAGYVADEHMVDDAIADLTEEMMQESQGLEIEVDRSAIECLPTEYKLSDIESMDEEQLEQAILSANICKAMGYSVFINGDNVLSARSEAAANEILAGVKNYYLTPGSEVKSASFKEDVVVTRGAVNVADLTSNEEAISLIVTGTKEPKIYTVQEGDNLWDIAMENGMTTDELAAANPGFEPDTLKIGQQLNLFETRPYVTVVTKEIVATTENIEFQTEYKNTDTLYKGQVKVETPGVYGTKQLKTELTKENGVVVASTELDAVVVAEPQTQIALKGTKSIATFTGSGSFSSPVTHIEISSAYGVNRGSTRHTGVDFRNPKGTPIYAVDDGVVVSVTNSGSPGKMVKISHGNGLETLYEHCDTTLVSVGQVVSKGEQIATVGATGNATGYHLHFEVRLNGNPQNPMNYL